MPSLLRLPLIALASTAAFFLLLFVGAAATGKDSLAAWIALALGFIATPALLLYLWRAPAPEESAGNGFEIRHRSPIDREDGLARLTASVAGSSYVVLGLLGVAAYAAATAWHGSLSSLYTAFMLKGLIIAGLYALSLWLLVTQRGKSVRRRAFSWGYSAAFHAALPVYLGVIEKIGDVILVLCVPEILAAVLCLAGLGLLIHARFRPQDA